MQDRKEAIHGEIVALKSLLADSDYAFFKIIEQLMACTTSTGIVNVLKASQVERGALAANRQAWRDRINELEAQYAALDEGDTE
jgi:hypothetical protein